MDDYITGTEQLERFNQHATDTVETIINGTSHLQNYKFISKPQALAKLGILCL